MDGSQSLRVLHARTLVPPSLLKRNTPDGQITESGDTKYIPFCELDTICNLEHRNQPNDVAKRDQGIDVL